MKEFFRIGESVLEVAADDPALLTLFHELYSDCALSASPPPEQLLVRCAVRRQADPPLLHLTVLEGAPPDPTTVALNLLAPPTGEPSYAVDASSIPGWQLITSGADRQEPLLAVQGSHMRIDERRVPRRFLVDYLVSATLAVQPELLAVHAACVHIGDAGLLLVGPSGAGKTTTSLNLAARGHTLLGDEVSLIHPATNEILPLRRTTTVRAGPRGAELAAALARVDGRDPAEAEGWWGSFRIGDLFPGSVARPVRLRTAFFLCGFSDEPKITRFQPTLDRMYALGLQASRMIVATYGGYAPGRRVLKLLALKEVFAQVPCWLLEIGPPDATADLIEQTWRDYGPVSKGARRVRGYHAPRARHAHGNPGRLGAVDA